MPCRNQLRHGIFVMSKSKDQSELSYTDVHNQFIILELMLLQLPAEVRTPLIGQLNKTKQSLSNVFDIINDRLSDVNMNVKYIQFDLHATKSERDKLQSKLDEMR